MKNFSPGDIVIYKYKTFIYRLQLVELSGITWETIFLDYISKGHLHYNKGCSIKVPEAYMIHESIYNSPLEKALRE